MNPSQAAQHQLSPIFLQFGAQLQAMFLRMFVSLILLFGPAFVIAYIIDSRYGSHVRKKFPFLRGQLLQPVLIGWVFVAYFTYLPALLRFWLRP